MIRAFVLALAQLRDPALRAPLWRALLIALVLYALLWTGLYLLLTRTRLFAIGWIEGVIDALGGLAGVVLTMILFPGLAAAIVALFLDGVVAAVERRYYPDLPAPRVVPLGEQVVSALRFLVTVVGLNLLVLPLYLIPLLNLVVFHALNGYLLGREYAEIVAPRRLDPAQWAELWRRQRSRFVLAGVVIALFSTIPLVNLLAPVIAAAAMTHLLESTRRETG
jgi:uncharacterized protein involved in cysteine biosynthesis